MLVLGGGGLLFPVEVGVGVFINEVIIWDSTSLFGFLGLLEGGAITTGVSPTVVIPSIESNEFVSSILEMSNPPGIVPFFATSFILIPSAIIL